MSDIPVAVEATLASWLAIEFKNAHPDHEVPWFISLFRHLCPEARSSKLIGKPISTAIDLKEEYVTFSEVRPDLANGEEDYVIVYRRGQCGKCNQVAMSRIGKVFSVAERPPLTGRVAR